MGTTDTERAAARRAAGALGLERVEHGERSQGDEDGECGYGFHGGNRRKRFTRFAAARKQKSSPRKAFRNLSPLRKKAPRQ
jgi:hypothetical protein